MANNYQLLFNSLQRLQAFPLDSTSVFETEGDLREYLKNNRTAYPGQIVAVNELQNVFVVVSEEDRLSFLRVGISDEKVAEIAAELDEKQYKEVIEPVLEKITSLIEKLQFEITEVDRKTTEKFVDIGSRLSEIERKIANGEIGGNVDCECIPLKPFTEEEIESLFKDINGDCEGVEDPEEVIEPIPSVKINALFNEVNSDCEGVEDPEEVIEPIPSMVITNLFDEINDC